MSDRMIPLSIDQLYISMMKEYQRFSTIWGIEEKAFYHPEKYHNLYSQRFGQLLESPVGVAAGPQTQLAQNIISSWLCGARYIELKTVQILDHLDVKKPCIDMEDEGFNTEWSQELSLEQSYQEYLNAFVLIYVLREKFNLKPQFKDQNIHLMESRGFGTIFNMSAGYNLEGIKSPKMMNFLKKMVHCPDEIRASLALLQEIDPTLRSLRLESEGLTDNITLSIMHGCPPDEVEQISRFLISELKIHTTLKLNPTLNGPHDVRKILNSEMGYKNVIVPDVAFEHDLKFEDAVKIIRRLQILAKENSVHFSIKLTNTLETQNVKGLLPIENEMNYMSGRALHPLAINLAKKLVHEFSGNLDITFAAGADAFNVASILKVGFSPVTVCSDLLKPGGYMRLVQYFINIDQEMQRVGANSLLDFVSSTSDTVNLKSESEIDKDEKKLQNIKIKNIDEYHSLVMKDRRYHKDQFPWPTIKTKTPLESFDCIHSPCVTTCPTHQEIPSYMYWTAKGDFAKALAVITENNPLPNTTGMACDHICEDKCTRINYDRPLHIRDIKRFVAHQGRDLQRDELVPKRRLNKSVSIIGGGPSGLSCAYFLAREGFKVEIFEAKEELGGMITYALPNFRTIPERVKSDIERILQLGVKVHLNYPVKSQEEFIKIKEKSDYLYLSVGAQKSKRAGVKNEELSGCYDFLTFLEEVKLGIIQKLPRRVLVIGGGNSAIDVVRSAKRLLVNQKDSELHLVYRRGKEDMPASREELFELSTEEISILEFLAPVEVVGNDLGQVVGLKVQRMEKKINDQGKVELKNISNSEQILLADMVIFAIGQERNLDFLPNDLAKKVLSDQLNFDDSFYAGGDVIRGPSSIIKGIADGKNVALSILKKEGIDASYDGFRAQKKLEKSDLMIKKSIRDYGHDLPRVLGKERETFQVSIKDMTEEEAINEAKRCLSCDEICSVCVTVCPNRANISYNLEIRNLKIPDIQYNGKEVPEIGELLTYEISQKNQVMNIGDFCNECGNCATFCPTQGRPFKDKPKIYFNKEIFLKEGATDKSYHFDRKEKELFFFWKGELFSLLKRDQLTRKYHLSSPWGEFDFFIMPFSIVKDSFEEKPTKKVLKKRLEGEALFQSIMIFDAIISEKVLGFA